VIGVDTQRDTNTAQVGTWKTGVFDAHATTGADSLGYPRGFCRAQVALLADTSATSLRAFLLDHFEEGATVITDGLHSHLPATREPYVSARRGFWGLDNGSSHAEQASIERLEGAYENLRLNHLPIPRLLVQSDRALLLDHAAQGALPQRLRLPR